MPPETSSLAIAVPIVERLPQDDPHYFGVDVFTAYLITASLRYKASELRADFHIDGGRWHVRGWSPETMGPDEVVAVTESKGRFRAVLAHIGTHYLTGQMHGGYGEVAIDHAGRLHRLVIYMANDGWRGYWLRAFTASP